LNPIGYFQKRLAFAKRSSAGPHSAIRRSRRAAS